MGRTASERDLTETPDPELWEAPRRLSLEEANDHIGNGHCGPGRRGRGGWDEEDREWMD